MPSKPATASSEPAPDQGWARSPGAWRITTWLAAAFCVLMGLAMVREHFRLPTGDPLSSARALEARRQLRLNPVDERLKQEIRALDLQSRWAFFRHLAQERSGAYLLLGGAAVFLLAFSRIKRGTLQLPRLQGQADEPEREERAATRACRAVIGAGAIVGALLLLAGLSPTTALSRRPTEPKLAAGLGAARVNDSAPLEELKANWTQFHGVDGGATSCSDVPTNWNDQTGAGIAWKVALPAAGFSSPIVWRDQVFLSGGDTNRREVFCLDAGTGRMLWRRDVPGPTADPAQPPAAANATGIAAPTPATDGRRIYAMFGDGALVALNLAGQPLWSKQLGPLHNVYGHASSLAMWQNRLIVQIDQSDSEAGKSRLYAFDGPSGQVLWQRPRRVGNAWASPLAIEVAGKTQIIALAVPWVIAYAATDGAELWRVECLGGEVTPSPAFAGGLLFIASPGEKLLAIRPNGSGDVTKTHIAWTTEENVPDITTPVANGELVFTVSSAGVLSCFDAKSGKKQWEHDFDMECHASPSLAGNRLYFFGQKGRAVVIEAGRQFKEIFRTEMDDAFHASPAFAQNRIFLRGESNVWCLATGVAPAKKEP